VTKRDVSPVTADPVIAEADIIELGFTAAAWLAAASGDPWFMLAGLKLREQAPP
jgi:hypothetical protein